MSKPRLAHVVLGGCEGCYVSLLDAHEALIELADTVDLVHSPLSRRTRDGLRRRRPRGGSDHDRA